MTDLLAQSFGDSRQRVAQAIRSLQSGRGILLLDDNDRENEGDLIFSTQYLRVEQMAQLIRECSGIVCLCIESEQVNRLELRPMVENNSSVNGTAFTVSIEATEGVTTGVSAHDRVQTIKTACDPMCRVEDLRRPGHVFPLRAEEGGVLARRGHTEGTVDMMKLAGLAPSGVLCELTNEDGTMARLAEVVEFGLKHNYPVLTIEDIAEHRLQKNYRSAV